MSALRIFFRVVWALMKREALTRNGHLRFGYIWAFLEPAVYLLGFVLFRSFVSTRVPFGDNAAVYMITALLSFRTAMMLSRRTMGAIQSNLALLTFPQVKTLDVILARVLLEGLTWIGITAAFVFGLYLVTGVWAIQSLETFFAGYSVTLLFGASFGFFNATFVRLFPFWDRIVGLASLPLLFASGVLITPNVLPLEVLNWLWWNPYLHLVEWVRAGAYLDYPGYYTPAYVISVSLVLLFIGLFLNRFFQRRMLLE